MSKYEYNLVVIGAGSAGLVTSYIAAAAKAKVALVEKHRMGGDCLNTGCVPSKALIRSASFMRDIRRAHALGFVKAEAEMDFAQIMERVQRVIRKIEPHDSIERFTSLGVDCFTDEAKIVSPNEVQVGERVLKTRSIVVCAGAAPFVPPIPGIEKANYKTSDTIWEIREKPRRMVVVGGGPIGSELAQAFAYLGVEVTQIEGGPRIMSREDEDCSRIVARHFEEIGVKIMAGTSAVEIQNGGGETAVLCRHKESGEETRVPFDLLLVATGRKPNGDKVAGLAEAGVRIDKRGAIPVDEYLRTSVPNIYACGDIIGSYQFTHTAGHAAYYAAMNAMLGPLIKQKVNWSAVPWCTFTHPEVARVGLNEQEAKQKEIEYDLVKYGIDDLDRAIADEEGEGFVKLLVEPGGKKLLGVTIVGAHAGDLIHEYILAMKHNLSPDAILSTIHIYPTLAEANRFAASEWKKSRLSPRLLAIGERLNRWLRG